MGCRWWVGNEKSIDIWTDYWVPGFRTIPQLDGYSQRPTQYEKVESLIRFDTRMWDIEGVQSILSPEVVVAFLKLILPSEPKNGKLF